MRWKSASFSAIATRRPSAGSQPTGQKLYPKMWTSPMYGFSARPTDGQAAARAATSITAPRTMRRLLRTHREIAHGGRTARSLAGRRPRLKGSDELFRVLALPALASVENRSRGAGAGVHVLVPPRLRGHGTCSSTRKGV